MKGLVVGQLGSAEAINASDITGPAAAFVLGAWLLEIPKVHPVWDHYYLTLIHLRAEDGGPPPELHYAGATHELMLSALDPEHKPDKQRPMELRPMRPANVAVQFTAETDEQAVSVLQHVAQALVDGSLPAEPEGIMGSHAYWTERVRWFAGHVKETGCEEAQAAAAGEGGSNGG